MEISDPEDFCFNPRSLCLNCDDGRKGFLLAIDLIAKQDFPEVRKARMTADFERLLLEPTNCGHPRCPNRIKGNHD